MIFDKLIQARCDSLCKGKPRNKCRRMRNAAYLEFGISQVVNFVRTRSEYYANGLDDFFFVVSATDYLANHEHRRPQIARL